MALKALSERVREGHERVVCCGSKDCAVPARCALTGEKWPCPTVQQADEVAALEAREVQMRLVVENVPKCGESDHHGGFPVDMRRWCLACHEWCNPGPDLRCIGCLAHAARAHQQSQKGQRWRETFAELDADSDKPVVWTTTATSRFGSPSYTKVHIQLGGVRATAWLDLNRWTIYDAESGVYLGASTLALLPRPLSRRWLLWKMRRLDAKRAQGITGSALRLVERLGKAEHR